MLKLIKSVCYHYSSEKPVTITALILRKIIIETIGFAKGSISHTVLVNIKKREKKDRASTSILESFLGKLGKGKGYVSVKNATQVDDSNQTFKVFERSIFDEEVHTLEDISDILGSLSERKSFELE